MTASLTKHVSEGDPVLLDQDLEAFEGAVIRVEQQLGECAELGCSIPAVRTVHDDVVLFHCYRLQDLMCARQDAHE